MSGSDIVKDLCTWAQKAGMEKVKNVPKGIAPGTQYEVANQLVFQNMKKFIGLDKCKFMMYAAAPLKQ